MSEFVIALVGLVVGVLLGGWARGRRRSTPDPAPPSPERRRLRELLTAADDLEYGLNTVLNFGPLSTTELNSVDLSAKLDRIVRTGTLDDDTLDALRTHTEKIGLHPFPERRELFTAVQEDEAAVWLVLREAVGSGAAQHTAAANARRCLEHIRAELKEELGRHTPEGELVLV
ncbi:hypothetical protein [Actinosynnema sp. NPDC020468]|uniref:hypothetical protein n=1 Tax=Actinosynnema sp. NPDC020468 TaxID=3154488 RepID=UPI0034003605